MKLFFAVDMFFTTIVYLLLSCASASYSEFDNITLIPNNTFIQPNTTSISKSSNSLAASLSQTSLVTSTSLPSSQDGVARLSTASNLSAEHLVGSTSSINSSNITQPSSAAKSSGGIGGYVASGLGLDAASDGSSSARSTTSTSIPDSQAGIDLSSAHNITGVYPIGSTSSIYSSVIPITSVTSSLISNSTVHRSYSRASDGITRSSSILNFTNSDGSHFNTSSDAKTTASRSKTAVPSVKPISSPRNGSTSALPFGLPVASNTTGNRTLDHCWAQWETYWGSQPATTVPAYSASTSTVTLTIDPETATTVSTIILNTYTWTTASVVNGFTMKTSTYTETDTDTDIGTRTGSPGSTFTTTSVATSPLWDQNATTRVGRAPSCQLPKSVPQCQASWSSYASVMLSPLPDPFQCEDQSPACQSSQSKWYSSESILTSMRAKPPLCSQASIGGSLCDALRSSYVSAGFTNGEVATTTLNPLWYPDSLGGVTAEASTVLVGGTANYVSYNANGGGSTISSGWPSGSTFAPGCTLGCARCAITAGTVQLIHWPATASPNNGTMTAANNSIVVATAMGTVFTSPTLYVSFDNVYASDSCGAIGPTHSSAIVAIPTSLDLSSVWADKYPFTWIEKTASFNVTDLNPPVPLSIYSRQPWCGVYSASQEVGYALEGRCGNQTDTAKCTPICPMTRPYNPIIVLPEGVLNGLDPAWDSCSMDIRGAYDPPYLLTPATIAAAPSASATAIPESQSADPGSSPAPVTATATSSPSSPSASAPAGYSSASSPSPSNPASPSKVGPQSGISKTRSTKPPADPPAASNDPGSLQSQPDPPSSGSAVDLSSAASNALSILHGGSSTSEQASIPPPGPADPSGAISSILSALSSPSTDPVQSTTTLSAADPATNMGSSQISASPTVIAGQTVSADPVGSGAVIGSQTVPPGAVTSIQGTQVSVGTNNIVLGSGSTIALVPTDSMSSQLSIDSSHPQVSGPANDPASAQQSQASEPGTAPAAVLTLSGQTYTVQSGSPLTLAGTTVTQNGAPATISGQEVSVGNGGAVIGSSTFMYSDVPVPASSMPAAAVFTIGSTAYTASSGQPIVLGSETLSAGGPAATISGQSVTVGSGGVVVGGSSVAYSPRPAPASNTAPAAVVTVAGQTYTAPSGGSLVIGSSTLSEGAPALTIGGQTISVGSSGVNVDGSSVAFSQPPPIPTPAPAAVFTVGGQTYTAQSDSSLVIGGSTLSQGGPGLTTSGQVISVGTTGVVVDGSSIAYTSAPAAIAETGAVITVGGNPYTVQSGSSVVIAGSTLSADGPAATISGQVVSLGSSGVNVGSSIVPYSEVPVPQSQETAAVFTVGGQQYTIQSGSPLIIAGSTLSAGGSAVTVSGEVISLGTQGVDVGSSTLPYSAMPAVESPETAAVITVGGQIYTAQSGSPLVVAGSTLSAGGPALTVASETISAAPDGILIDGSTVAYSTFAAPSASASPELEAPFTISNTGYTAYKDPDGNDILVAGPSSTLTTLTPGGAAATISGQVISAVSTGVVVGSSTIPFQTITPTTALEAPFTLGGQAHTAIETTAPDHSSIAVIDASITLTEGGSGTVMDGTSMSMASDGIVLGGSSTVPWRGVAVGPDDSPIPTMTGAGSFSGAGVPTGSAGTSGAGGGDAAATSMPSSLGNRHLDWRFEILVATVVAVLVAFL